MTEATLEERIDEYRARLAEIREGGQIAAECIGAVFYGGVEAPMDGDQEIGTILAVKHERGWGLFGPQVWTYIKLCPSCVHQKGANCVEAKESGWRIVLWVDEIRRNGDPRGSEEDR